MAQPPNDGPDPTSNPGGEPSSAGDGASNPVEDPTPGDDASSLGVVIGILAVLTLIAVALVAALVARSADDEAAPPFGGESAGVVSGGAEESGPPPSAESSPAPDEPSALPSGDGPDEDQYVAVARKFVKAARAGKCAKARQFTDDIFDTAISDANLCQGFTRRAMQNDDLGNYAVNFFGNYGAAVEFDGGRTYVSLVAAPDGPLVEVLIAY